MNSILKNSLLIMNLEQNSTNSLYFSHDNISVIQSELIKGARQKTGYTIGKQNCTDIVTAMQYFYMNYPQFTFNQNTVRENILNLNSLVVNDLLKQIVSNVIQYTTYLKQRDSYSNPLEYGKSVSLKGENSLQNNVLF